MTVGPQSPFRRHLTQEFEVGPVGETEFEKQRGINHVEVRPGYVNVRVRVEGEPRAGRLAALESIARAGVSLDFLKLGPDGFSFVSPEEAADSVRQALEGAGLQHEVLPGRCVVLVHAVNMRDEEGLIARIVSKAIASGAEIDHLGDMHDRVLMVTRADQAEALRACLEALKA